MTWGARQYCMSAREERAVREARISTVHSTGMGDRKTCPTACYGLLVSRKALVKFPEQTCFSPKLPVADHVNDFFRASDCHVQQVRSPASPATSPGLKGMGCTQNENHSLGFAPLNRVHSAYSLVGPAPIVLLNPVLEHSAFTDYSAQPVGNNDERRDDYKSADASTWAS